MALDVYVGPLTLYYAGQWENHAQMSAWQQGAVHHTIRLNEPKNKRKDPERIRAAIVEWRGQLSDGLGPNIMRPLDWDEHSEDYATVRPNWDGFGSLVLWAAYDDHKDLQPPAHFVELSGDPAYERATAQDAESLYPHLIRDIEFWLPSPFDFTFKAEGPNGDVVSFGSTVTLLRHLRDLNNRTWKADLAMIEAWGVTAPKPDGPLEEAAKYGFSDLFTLAEIACLRGMPMKLDY
ncbi:MAG: hypothetical protein Q8M19_28655 [Reyranella sp.]|nr:hypothetical protein [Reyranella sp.]